MKNNCPRVFSLMSDAYMTNLPYMPLVIEERRYTNLHTNLNYAMIPGDMLEVGIRTVLLDRTSKALNRSFDVLLQRVCIKRQDTDAKGKKMSGLLYIIVRAVLTILCRHTYFSTTSFRSTRKVVLTLVTQTTIVTIQMYDI